jgi:hypothetical protein
LKFIDSDDNENTTKAKYVSFIHLVLLFTIELFRDDSEKKDTSLVAVYNQLSKDSKAKTNAAKAIAGPVDSAMASSSSSLLKARLSLSSSPMKAKPVSGLSKLSLGGQDKFMADFVTR